MPKIVYSGPINYRIRSWKSLIRISILTLTRRMIGKPLVTTWSTSFEISVLFWREQFNRALAMPSIKEGRTYFDSLQTFTDEIFDVERISYSGNETRGSWITPKILKDDVTILYLHGGGYTFSGGISERFADMLAALLKRRLFTLDYRLTPEHPHPAQLEDATHAYQYLLSQNVDPAKLVVLGDSAGGHLALMLLLKIQKLGLPQPALAIGLCPWTDIGKRGDSLFINDTFDLVQGYMTLQFGKWLKAGTKYSREELSPIYQDFSQCAPIYFQAGALEILVDMIKQFAEKLNAERLEITLDIWPDMTHNFQAHGKTLPESEQALSRIDGAITHYTSPTRNSKRFSAIETTVFPPTPNQE